ncbi:hypothetical protein C0992_007619 [Termitomyces sp. T32_za158]|nr:hypothetical protein C0992_007619 [Termitomyces sp. T32_za158]
MSNPTNFKTFFHIPAVAPAVENSSEAPELELEPQSPPKEITSTPGRVKRLSAVVEKSVDKLSRGFIAISGRTSPTTPPPAGRSRLFSLSRKGKTKENSADVEESLPAFLNLTQSASSSTLPKPANTSTSIAPREGFPLLPAPIPFKPPIQGKTFNEESPFITPPSPPPTRPPLSPFRGDGSMRAGTQTLIQALQALPWAEVDNDEDIMGTDANSSDEEEGSEQPSSIHTIHRPLARSKKLSISYPTQEPTLGLSHRLVGDDQVLKSGSLNKKAQRTKRWIKHWFVLKNDALSWYQSSSDPYFPHGIVDLRYAISCEAEGDRGFRIRTNQKTVILSADSVPSREEWVKAIRKVIFKAQNMGDCVKIAVPYSLIIDVDKSSAMDFSETIEVKVFDKNEDSSVDSYFFAYFHDIPEALEHIRNAVRDHRNQPDPPSSPPTVLDTTQSRPSFSPDRTASLPLDSNITKSSSVFRLSSLLRPFQDTFRTTVSEGSLETEDFTHVSKRPNSSSFVPVTTSPKPTEGLPETHPDQTSKSLPANEHTYPPSTSNSRIDPDHPSLSRESSSWVGVPSWLKSTRRVFGGSLSSDQTTTTSAGVKEMYSSTTVSPSYPTSRSTMGDLAFSVLETPEISVDAETTEKFRTAFAYDEKETLLGSTEKSKATRFGHHGLIIIIKGHEELFFEFNAEDKRDAFIKLLDRQVEDVRERLAQGELNPTSPGKRQALILEEFDATASESDPAPTSTSDTLADSLPAVMFTSASSTFLTFKPATSLHFTFLTIGSRGDVQPYIALAKCLMADGHRCKIATHGEFKDWIESVSELPTTF